MGDSWVYNNADDMEIGDTGFVNREDGWMVNKYNGYKRDPDGRVYDSDDQLVFDPADEEDLYGNSSEYGEEEEYEWWDIDD